MVTVSQFMKVTSSWPWRGSWCRIRTTRQGSLLTLAAVHHHRCHVDLLRYRVQWCFLFPPSPQCPHQCTITLLFPKSGKFPLGAYTNLNEGTSNKRVPKPSEATFENHYFLVVFPPLYDGSILCSSTLLPSDKQQTQTCTKTQGSDQLAPHRQLVPARASIFGKVLCQHRNKWRINFSS